MYSQLYKYLVARKKVNIAGVGYFTMQPVPSRLNFMERMLYAPQATVIFTPDTSEVISDKNFYQYLAKELKVNEWEAIRQYQAFSEDIKQQIENSGSVDIPGIGCLHKAYDNNGVHFVAGRNSYRALRDIYLGASLQAEVSPEEETEELYNTGEALIVTEDADDEQFEKIVKEQKKDYWWVYAIILAIIGIAALLYYYI